MTKNLQKYDIKFSHGPFGGEYNMEKDDNGDFYKAEDVLNMLDKEDKEVEQCNCDQSLELIEKQKKLSEALQEVQEQMSNVTMEEMLKCLSYPQVIESMIDQIDFNRTHNQEN